MSLFLVVKLQPSSIGAFLFLAAWLALPLVAMAALLLWLRSRGRPLLPWCIATLLVTFAGLYLLLDAIYLHPDSQSAIGVVLTPVLQGIAFIVAAPLVWWAEKRLGAKAR